MKHILFIIALSFTVNATSQIWIDINATWNFGFDGAFYGGIDEFNYSSDTIVDGVTCQKIEVTRVQHFPQSDGSIVLGAPSNWLAGITYVNGDTVFYRNNDEFFPLLNFSAQVGDSWVIATVNPDTSNMCGDTSKVMVTQTGTMTINSVIYRTLTLESVANSSYYFQGTFVERFGQISTEHGVALFPIQNQCDPNAIIEWSYNSFRCFEDDSFSSYNPSGTSCNYYLGVEEVDSQVFSIYPNPSSTILNIELELAESTSCSIFNSLGEMIMAQELNSNQSVLNISELTSGLYLIKIGEKATTFLKE